MKKRILNIDLKNRICESITVFFILGFIVLLLGSQIISLYYPDKEDSSLENRDLAQYEEISILNTVDGSWQNKFDIYNRDQFFARSKCIRLFYIIKDALGIKERNGYVLGDDKMILPIQKSTIGENDISENIDSESKEINNMMEILKIAEEYGGKVIYMNVPEKHELYYDRYPNNYNSNKIIYDLNRKSIISKVKELGITCVETYDLLESHKNEFIYFDSDNHWTIKGAYYAYQELLSTLNGKFDENLIFPKWDELNVMFNDKEKMEGGYLKVWGNSKLLLDEHMIFAYPNDVPEYVRYDNGEMSDTPILNTNGYQYNSYIGGNIGNTVIDTNRDELPSILWIGYSFTNPLEVLSTYNFNKMESIDSRYWDGSICDYIYETKPNYIVVLKDDDFSYRLH